MSLQGQSRTIVGTWSWGKSSVWDFGITYGEAEIRQLLFQLCSHELFLDTAPGYGNGRTEHLIGEVMASHSPPWRIISKIQPWHSLTRGQMRHKLVASLRRLRVHRIEELVLHNPIPRALISQVVTGLVELQRERLIDGVGLSNYSQLGVREFVAVASEAGLTVRSLQRSGSLVSQSVFSDGTVELCRDRGIELIIHGVLGQGLLGGNAEVLTASSLRRRRISHTLLDQTRYLRQALAEVAALRTTTIAAVARAWVRAKGATPIYGVRTYEQLSGTSIWNDVDLLETDIEFLDGVSAPWRR